MMNDVEKIVSSDIERLIILGIEFYIIVAFTNDGIHYEIDIKKININNLNKEMFADIDLEELVHEISVVLSHNRFPTKEDSLEFLYRLIDAKAMSYRCLFLGEFDNKIELEKSRLRKKIRELSIAYENL